MLLVWGAYIWRGLYIFQNFMVTQARANLNFFRFTLKVRVIGNRLLIITPVFQ